MEEQLTDLRSRTQSNPLCQDIALRQFLQLLQWFRIVLLQDLAVIYAINPSCSIFQYPPFTLTTFKTFAESSKVLLKVAECNAEQALKTLPDTMAQSMRGLVQSLTQEQYHSRERSDAQWTLINSKLENMEALVMGFREGKSGKRKQGKSGAQEPGKYVVLVLGM